MALPATGTDFPSMQPLPAYYKPSREGKEPEQYVRMSAIEYQAGIKEAVPLLTKRDGKREGLRTSRTLWLLQDEGRPHTALSTATFARNFQSRGLQLVTLPTHSPDLTPMDAGFFGTVKREWFRRVKRDRLDWDQSCLLALKLLRETNPDNYITEMPLRWQACEEVRGGHIEARLKELKKK